MKKALIITLIILSLAGGFLYYDWHVKTKKMAAEPNITLYAWTDENGEKHFTDTQPPRGAKNIEEFKGYEHIKPPLVVQIKHKSVDFFNWIKGKLFKKTDDKKKKKRAEGLTFDIRIWQLCCITASIHPSQNGQTDNKET